MFFSSFYAYIKTIVSLFAICSGLAFIYSIFHFQIIDIIVLGFIFCFGTIVGVFLTKYYGNMIISFEIYSEDIVLVSMKKICFKLKKDDCLAIVNKPNMVIMKFDKENYYIQKYYFFKKSFFDFSELNKDNFKNARIIDF